MDLIDIKILNCLRKNSRLGASAIGEKVNMSVSAVIERIRKMERSGVIQQYSVLLDPAKIGMNLSAFVEVNLDHPKFNDSFCEGVKKNPKIVECHYVTGEFDFLLKVVTSTPQSLERVLHELKCIPGVSSTKTLVVLTTVKDEVTVLPELEPQPPFPPGAK